MRSVLIVFIFCLPLCLSAQKKKKYSYAEGTMFGYAGYNWASYSKSNIRFQGNGYDFTLQGAEAEDNPAGFIPSKIAVPQFSFKIGYYFWNYWALSFGVDHMNYILKDKNEVNISGTIDPGIDNNWSGTYDAEPVTTNRDDFHYANNGFNYLHLELSRTDPWVKQGAKDQFVVCSNMGITIGGLLTHNDFNFGGSLTPKTISMSGVGVSGKLGLRFELFRHFFIQPSVIAGYHQQSHVQTRPNNPYSYAKHGYGFAGFETVFGFLLYIRPANGCQSCPDWH